jgi:hypothetical protein
LEVQRKTIDPLEALDRAFREMVPEADQAAPRATPGPTAEGPLEVLRALAVDGGTAAAPAGGALPAPAATTQPAGPGKAEPLPYDPIEALRILESGLGAASQPSSPDKPTAHAPADPLQALRDMEKAQAELWGHSSIAPSASADETRMRESDGGDAPAADPEPASSPDEAGRPIAPLWTRTTPPKIAVDPAPPRQHAPEPGLRVVTQEPAKKSNRLFPSAPQFMAAGRRRRNEPVELKPVEDPGAAARAAFYRARQELGEGASLDEIIEHACKGLDRNAQEILFEIQLKILLGNS